jgi:hypothetical protein
LKNGMISPAPSPSSRKLSAQAGVVLRARRLLRLLLVRRRLVHREQGQERGQGHDRPCDERPAERQERRVRQEGRAALEQPRQLAAQQVARDAAEQHDDELHRKEVGALVGLRVLAHERRARDRHHGRAGAEQERRREQSGRLERERAQEERTADRERTNAEQRAPAEAVGRPARGERDDRHADALHRADGADEVLGVAGRYQVEVEHDLVDGETDPRQQRRDQEAAGVG